MKTALASILLSTALTSPLFAVVTLDLQADSIKTATVTLAPTSTLVLLVADTLGDGFGVDGLSGIAAGTSLGLSAFIDGLGGDDLIVLRDDLSFAATPGLFFPTPPTVTLTYGGGFAAGAPLALFWFPTLGIASNTATAGATFGSYGSFAGPALDGSSLWVAPTDGSSFERLYFFTVDGVGNTGTNTSSLGIASLTVAAAPEPSRWILTFFGLAFAVLRRQRSK